MNGHGDVHYKRGGFVPGATKTKDLDIPKTFRYFVHGFPSLGTTKLSQSPKSTLGWLKVGLLTLPRRDKV